jgi:hypothetical protein
MLMKTTRSFGPNFLAILVAFAPACKVTVDDSPEDEEVDSGPEDTTSDEEESDASGSPQETSDDENTSEGDASGSENTSSAMLTFEVETGEDGGTSGNGGDAGAGSDGRFGCGEVEITDEAMVVTEAIREPTTWSGVVVIEGGIDVNDGADLTIEPGTHIIMGNDANLEFGWAGGASTLSARGTAEEPIVFCGRREEKGYWGNITIQDGILSESELTNVRIFDGGGSSDAALILNAPVLVDNVIVQGSESAGVAAVDFHESSTGLSVFDSEQAVVLLDAPAATHFPLNGELDGNVESLARLTFTSIEADSVFFDLGIPYLQERTLDVIDGISVSFEAGVEYQFGADADLEVGWAGGAVAFNVNGTEEAPVVFRGASEQSGFWAGLVIRNNVLTNSSINYLQIKHAGGENRFALEIEAAITINHVELIDNERGMSINEAGLAEDSADLTIVGTEDYPLTIDPEALITLPRGGEFTGNETDQVVVLQNNFTGSGTAPNLGVPYLIRGSLDIYDGAELTLEPGTTFVMASDAKIELGWAGSTAQMTAVGTEDAPIVFTGEVEEAGSWGGINVGSNVLSASTLSYVEFEHAGGIGSVLSLASPIEVENCTFSDYTGAAILKEDSNTIDYTLTNVFNGDIGVDAL